MHLKEDLSGITSAEIEDIEKLTLRWLFQAFVDFGKDPKHVFWNSVDLPQDIAEDITREVLDRYSGNNVNQRIFGKVDYKKARYIILPEQIVRQALFVDSKAEKDRSKARLQVSQIPMNVRQVIRDQEVDVRGGLPHISVYNNKEYLTSVMLVHYYYQESDGKYLLKEISLAALPNGKLQDRYNPTAQNSIWDVGPNAETRGESFRTRLSFNKLKGKASWRIQTIEFDAEGDLHFEWNP